MFLSGASGADGVVPDGDFHVAVPERGDVDELLEPEVFVEEPFDEANDSFVDHLRLGFGGGDDELADRLFGEVKRNGLFLVGGGRGRPHSRDFAEDLDGAGVGFPPAASAG